VLIQATGYRWDEEKKQIMRMVNILYYRRLSKNGQINLPRELLKQIHVVNGDTLYIDYNCTTIKVIKQECNPTLNQCILSNGKISIPAEIRRFLEIPWNTLMKITIWKNNILIEKASAENE